MDWTAVTLMIRKDKQLANDYGLEMTRTQLNESNQVFCKSIRAALLVSSPHGEALHLFASLQCIFYIVTGSLSNVACHHNS